MTAVQAHAVDQAPTLSTGRAFALHLWAFALPLITLAYWWTGPHLGWRALLWTLPIVVLVSVDNRARGDARQPDESMPTWPFNLQLYLLIALQLTNYVLLGVSFAQVSIDSPRQLIELIPTLASVVLLPGVTAGYSGIVLGHELVHRRNPVEYFFGRVLLMGVLYEHFATEHVRGHHPRLGTYEDPATARFNETHPEFLRRTVLAQFKSAWHLENVRLGAPSFAQLGSRKLQHRVLQGVVGELAIVTAFFAFFGPLATFFFLVQAFVAVLLLETVNYVEHWGITRASKRVTTVDSWDTDNWFTLYTLVGLSRHADHHAQASRQYQRLRHFEESAKMPAGYYGTIIMALFANRRYIALATEELKRKGLGPFRAASVSLQETAQA